MLKKKKKILVIQNKLNNNELNIKIIDKESFRKYCISKLEKIRKIKVKDFGKNKKLETFFIEFRSFPHSEFLIRNTIYKLSSEWNHTVVCGNSNYNFMKDICSSISSNIKIIKLNFDNLTVEEYSNLLKTIDFWNMFEGEKLLLYQEDSCIFNSNIEKFLKYDYIGAPWFKYLNFAKTKIGNGGFSLRTKKVMIDCLKKNKIDKVNEDVYFSNLIWQYKLGLFPDYETAIEFSQEQVKSANPFGGHVFWGWNRNLQYLDNTEYFKYLN